MLVLQSADRRGGGCDRRHGRRAISPPADPYAVSPVMSEMHSMKFHAPRQHTMNFEFIAMCGC